MFEHPAGIRRPSCADAKAPAFMIHAENVTKTWHPRSTRVPPSTTSAWRSSGASSSSSWAPRGPAVDDAAPGHPGRSRRPRAACSWPVTTLGLLAPRKVPRAYAGRSARSPRLPPAAQDGRPERRLRPAGAGQARNRVIKHVKLPETRFGSPEGKGRRMPHEPAAVSNSGRDRAGRGQQAGDPARRRTDRQPRSRSPAPTSCACSPRSMRTERPSRWLPTTMSSSMSSAGASSNFADGKVMRDEVQGSGVLRPRCPRPAGAHRTRRERPPWTPRRPGPMTSCVGGLGHAFAFSPRRRLAGLRRNLSMAISVVLVTMISLFLLGLGLLAAPGRCREGLLRATRSGLDLLVHQGPRQPMCGRGDRGPEGQYQDPARSVGVRWSRTSSTSPKRTPSSASASIQGHPARRLNVKVGDIPQSYRVQLSDPAKFEVVASTFENARGRLGPGPKRCWRSCSRSSTGSPVFGVARRFDGGLCHLLMATTIRQAAFSRRREIGIMRLVGASNMAIRLPFIAETLIAALVGAGRARLLVARVKAQWAVTRNVVLNQATIGAGDVRSIAPYLRRHRAVARHRDVHDHLVALSAGLTVS